MSHLFSSKYLQLDVIIIDYDTGNSTKMQLKNKAKLLN